MSKNRITPLRFIKDASLRGYGIGERNPETLPGVYLDSEHPIKAAEADARWRKARHAVQGINGVGMKY